MKVVIITGAGEGIGGRLLDEFRHSAGEAVSEPGPSGRSFGKGDPRV
jgi:hypothetical protein